MASQIITLSSSSEVDLNSIVAEYITRGWSKVGNMWTKESFFYQKMAK